jgi:dihydroorotate dehydrogenase subfamily 2
MWQLMAKFIGGAYRRRLKPMLFRFDPEEVHDRFTRNGELLGKQAWTRFVVARLFRLDHPKLNQTIAGILFTNPVGLSAGFDKDGRLVNILPAVGFGFMEVGTVTKQPYPGNPKPRLYRLLKSHGIVVNYGLKNDGVDVIMARLRKRQPVQHFPISISIGKTNCQATATTTGGVEDYTAGLAAVVASGTGDFYTINISCPNTFGGEPFTNGSYLEQLLQSLVKVADKPMFLKMPINLPWPLFQQLLDVAVKFGVTGVVIGNLNKNREDPAIKDVIPSNIKGSVSGKPTWQLSNELISKTYQEYGKKLIIIGVGGIFSAQDAYEKIRRGASLVQLITGMIFQGPQLIGEINLGLVKLLERDGYKNISEAVGVYHR